MQRTIGIGMAVLLSMTSALYAGERSLKRYKGIDYDVYRCRPTELSLFWKDGNGTRYGNFSRLEESLERRGQRLVFAMNAGIYKLDQGGYLPCGLHVEGGKMLEPLNRATGVGNFYLKPNGVFYVCGDKAGILETEEFNSVSLAPRIAFQSGPLLVHNGRMHAGFLRDSPSLLHRNGIGLTANGDVIFAITVFRQGNRVNLYGFADFFRSLGCNDALFLDGDISTMWTPEDGPPESTNNFAAILAITKPLRR